MSVGCAEQPVEDVGHQEVAPVDRRPLRSAQPRENGLHARTALVFVFVRGRRASGLAHVFLGQAHEPVALGRQLPVEPLHDERDLVAEFRDFTSGHGELKAAENLHAEPLVLDRVLHVELQVADEAQR